MRLVIQRVSSAEVKTKAAPKTIGKIKVGLFVLVGVGEGDSKKVAETLAEKLSKLRIMADASGKMNFSLDEANGSILAVSQFTLYADTKKGNRPSFIKAAKPALAEEIYKHFISKLRMKGLKVETGSFGDYMTINSELDGPVTIILESD